MLEFHQYINKKKPKMWTMFIWFLVFVCLVYMMNMLIVTRVHYTIDVGGGLLFSFFFYRFCSKNVYWIDRLMSLPYVAGKNIYKKFNKKSNKND
jgi:hypothetical protein